MSYIVMECYSSYAVLLDEEGRFLKAANLQYEVGETVYNPVLMQECKTKTQYITRWFMGSMAVAAACLLLIFGTSWYQIQMVPYSSICLSINPEVEITLNKKGTVIGLTGANEDGNILLKGYNGKGKDKVTVAEELIDRAIDMGYLSEGGLIFFSIDTPEEKLLNEYGEQLRSGVKKHLEGRITITIEINSPEAQQTAPRQPKKSPVEKNDSDVDDKPPAVKPSVPADTDHGAENGKVTDYDDTDYGTENGKAADYDDTDYGAENGKATDYDDTDHGAENGKATDYDDTDYGTENDNVTDYKQQEQKPQQALPPSDNSDSDYRENKQEDSGDSDYRNGDGDDDDDNDDDDDDNDEDDDDD